MKLVSRTFTRIPESEGEEPVRVECLDEFIEARAYVILGASGSGKSTVFRQEARRCKACFVTARNFICLDGHEWGTSTLFIDALDEMRVGSRDLREPLDQIRAKLSQLGCPRFRISCRDGGWLGSNDLRSLKALTAGKDIPVLRLDPLGMEEIRSVLNCQLDGNQAQQLLNGAIERGLQGLLENPLTLTLLAEALSGSNWPRNRTEAFALACGRLVPEINDEHLIATSGEISKQEVLRMAGRLCTYQLLTGRIGYVRVAGRTDQDFVSLEDLGEVDPEALRRVLGSRIFESPGAPGTVAPIHRLVAEFLAARYLAKLVGKGLPVGRILSLVCGYDGHVVSEFVGVTAWLAALCKKSRVQIMERNALGVLLQGDIKEFSPDEKGILIDYVAKQPWRRDDYYRLINNEDARIYDLATPDMSHVFRRYLQSPVNDDVAVRAALVVVKSLQCASAVSGLTSDLLQIVRNDQWHPTIRHHALIAFRKQSFGDDQAPTELTALIEDVAIGDVHDEDDELLGLLLDSLYPSVLGANEIVRFLKVPQSASLYGAYQSFWYRLASREMTWKQLREILDALYVAMPNVKERFFGHQMEREIVSRLPGKLLIRYLSRTHTTLDHSQLYNWLELTFNLGSRIRQSQKQVIRDWMLRHPKDLRIVIEHGIKRCHIPEQTDTYVRKFRRIIDNIEAPIQLSKWLRKQSNIARDLRIKMSLRQLSERGIPQSDRSKTALRPQSESKYPTSSSHRSMKESSLETLFGSEPSTEGSDEDYHVEPWCEEWRAKVGQDLEAVRSGSCTPSVLNVLSRTYCGNWQSIDGKTPIERLRKLLGDQLLVNAALSGLRGVVQRSDIPTADQIAEFVKLDRIHPLAYPFLVGLLEIGNDPARSEEPLDSRQTRTALAFHFSTPFGGLHDYQTDSSDGTDRDSPPWFYRLLSSESEVVAEVLVKMARAEISKGSVLFDVMHKLETSPEYEYLARRTCIPLLCAIPIRPTATQMDGLGCLLRAAILHGDKEDLLRLVDKKLGCLSMYAVQRVYWLASGLFCFSAKYRTELIQVLSKQERLISHFVDFMVGASPLPTWKPPLDKLDVKTLEHLILSVGKLYRPLARGMMLIEGPIFVEALIKRLSEDPSQRASRSLSRLLRSPQLESWQSLLQEAQLRQATIRRSVSFRYVSIRKLHQTLNNRQPTGAADLAALTTDQLETIASRIRDGNTSGWRQYWDFGKGKSPAKPRHEDLCRDLLLDDLRLGLENLNIDAQPEGRYADDKRADIKVSYREFNVPIEIKKSLHKELWTSMRNQLVQKYTRDPGCDGHGIYVVLWFGMDGAVPSPNGMRPRSARELKATLVDSLTPSERLKLHIVVFDVSEQSS